MQKSKKKSRGTVPITTWSFNLFIFTRIESVQYTCDRIVFTLPTCKIYRPNIKMYVRTVNTFVILLRQSIYMLQIGFRIMWWFIRHCAHFSLFVVCIWWLLCEITKLILRNIVSLRIWIIWRRLVKKWSQIKTTIFYFTAYVTIVVILFNQTREGIVQFYCE